MPTEAGRGTGTTNTPEEHRSSAYRSTAHEQLRPLWAARSVAVIGASAKPGALGRLPVEYLLRYGYRGRILPVNPTATEILGLPSYPRVTDAPGPVDLALIMVSAQRVPDAIDDCAAAGVPVAIVASSGFAETGEEGAAAQAEIVRRARAGGVRLVGPNCIGAVGFADALVASFSPLFSAETLSWQAGGIGFVSQSGALGYGAVSLALERGLGLGWAVNTGNEADVTAVDVLRALADEPGCTGLLAYLESLTDGPGLRALAATGVPIAVLKAGRSSAGARAAASHTGALATGDRVIDGALRQLGIVRVDDVEDLLDVGDAFASPRRPTGPRVAVVTTSGGSGILAADAIEQAGLQLSRFAPATNGALQEIVPAFGAIANPVDVTATVMSDLALFDRCLDAVAADDGVDMVVACFCVLVGDDVEAIVASLARIAQESGKPVLVARTGADHLAPKAGAALRAAGIPAYPTPARAVRAAAALWQVSQRRAVDPSSPSVTTPLRRIPAPPPGASETQLKALLADAGFPVPTGRLATDRDDAVAAVTEVGGRAVLKAVVPGLLHKTEAGGVVLDVTPATAAEHFDRLAAIGAGAGAVHVEEMVTGGVELLVGIAPSPLGPVLTVGSGGVLTEVMDDVALRLLPVTRRDVEEMVTELKAAALLAGVRGRPPMDTAALVDLLLSLAKGVADWPAGFEFDLNPVIALPHGVRILDAAYVGGEG